MARPNKNEALAIKKRDESIFIMKQKGYPLDYIASFYNVSKGRIVQILKTEQQKINKES